MSITQPKGFRAAGVACGLKDNALDFALVVNDGPSTTAAAVTTSNRIYAAPVRWTREAVVDGNLRAVALNSGGANACTGEEGYADAVATAHLVASAITAAPADVAVCSTGLIGERLNMRAIRSGVGMAVEALSPEGGEEAARAIMTTDTRPKTAAVTRKGWSLGGMAKGAGMLAPQLATMLVVLTTDARIEPEIAAETLREAVEFSFNRLDSDGCMSTNDTVLLLCSGASGITPEPHEFEVALEELCHDLARQLIADAEGAAHDITITVTHAASQAAGVAVARAVSRSNLLKAAVFGKDPNWGRVLSSIGTVPQWLAPFQPDDVDVSINGVMVCKGGAAHESRDKVDMSGREVEILIDLKAGEEKATLLTNDLTYDYVTENSAYSS